MEEPKIELFEEEKIQKDAGVIQELPNKKSKDPVILAIVSMTMVILSSLTYFIFKFNNVNKGADYMGLPKVIYLFIFIPFLFISFFSAVSLVSKIEEAKIKKIILIVLGTVSGLALSIWFYFYFSNLNFLRQADNYSFIAITFFFFLFYFIFWILSGKTRNKQLKLSSALPIFVWAVFFTTILEIAALAIGEGIILLFMIIIVLTAYLYIRYLVLFFKNRKNLDKIDMGAFVINVIIASYIISKIVH